MAARGQSEEAIDYVLRTTDDHAPVTAVTAFCERVLLDSGRRSEAYERFALAANQAHTNIARFRAIAAKYPEVPRERILDDLVASSPGDEGKWFATAKTLGLLDLARALAIRAPCDPKTLTRAARDHVEKNPAFAADVALAALGWIAAGRGFELTSLDVREAYRYAIEAADRIGRGDEARRRVGDLLSEDGAMARWMRESLGVVR